jgi:hypothetical protein
MNLLEKLSLVEIFKDILKNRVIYLIELGILFFSFPFSIYYTPFVFFFVGLSFYFWEIFRKNKSYTKNYSLLAISVFCLFLSFGTDLIGPFLFCKKPVYIYISDSTNFLGTKIETVKNGENSSLTVIEISDPIRKSIFNLFPDKLKENFRILKSSTFSNDPYVIFPLNSAFFHQTPSEIAGQYNESIYIPYLKFSLFLNTSILFPKEHRYQYQGKSELVSLQVGESSFEFEYLVSSLFSPWNSVKMEKVDDMKAITYSALLDDSLTSLSEEGDYKGIKKLSFAFQTSPNLFEKARIASLIAMLTNDLFSGNIGESQSIACVVTANRLLVSGLRKSGPNNFFYDGSVIWVTKWLYQYFRNFDEYYDSTNYLSKEIELKKSMEELFIKPLKKESNQNENPLIIEMENLMKPTTKINNKMMRNFITKLENDKFHGKDNNFFDTEREIYFGDQKNLHNFEPNFATLSESDKKLHLEFLIQSIVDSYFKIFLSRLDLLNGPQNTSSKSNTLDLVYRVNVFRRYLDNLGNETDKEKYLNKYSQLVNAMDTWFLLFEAPTSGNYDKDKAEKIKKYFFSLFDRYTAKDFPATNFLFHYRVDNYDSREPQKEINVPFRESPGIESAGWYDKSYIDWFIYDLFRINTLLREEIKEATYKKEIDDFCQKVSNTNVPDELPSSFCPGLILAASITAKDEPDYSNECVRKFKEILEIKHYGVVLEKMNTNYCWPESLNKKKSIGKTNN